ncbi:hypothetical protein SDC9_151828 [bioreactor metagenome]|uniref:Uncharacterized protein n=1 Tax=bioreactor metagenome TaxID=1076179 RepID=A0A645ERX9_9ZZZZ
MEPPGIGQELSHRVRDTAAIGVVPRITREECFIITETEPVSGSCTRGVFPFGFGGQAVEVAGGESKSRPFLLSEQRAIVRRVAPGDIIDRTLQVSGIA